MSDKYHLLKCSFYDLFKITHQDSNGLLFTEHDYSYKSENFLCKVNYDQYQDIYMMACIIRGISVSLHFSDSIFLDYKDTLGFLKSNSSDFNVFDNDFDLDNFTFVSSKAILSVDQSFRNYEEQRKHFELIKMMDNLIIRVGKVPVKVHIGNIIESTSQLEVKIEIKYNDRKIRGKIIFKERGASDGLDYMKKSRIVFNAKKPEGELQLSRVFLSCLDKFAGNSGSNESIVKDINNGLEKYNVYEIASCFTKIINNYDKFKDLDILMDYSESDDPCCICQCDNDDVEEFKGIEKNLHKIGIKLGCLHHLCVFCALEYIQKSGRSAKCPICRARMKITKQQNDFLKGKTYEEIANSKMPDIFQKIHEPKMLLENFKIDKNDEINEMSLYKVMMDHLDNDNESVVTSISYVQPMSTNDEELNSLNEHFNSFSRRDTGSGW